MNLKELKDTFISIYGGGYEDLRVFYSPGRVNLIGEHTDYTGGFVFPAALTLGTTIIARKNSGKLMKLAATDLEDRVSADTSELENYKALNWGNYQTGVAYVMQKNGFDITGCELLYHDTTPHGAGLSSSAAIEVATATMFATFSNEKNGIEESIDMKQMAVLSQKAENEYIGVNCGIMDQFASAMGKKNSAIYLNCKNLDFRLVPLSLDGLKIVISNTNKKRSLATSAYNERRKSCEDGFLILNKFLKNATCLGDISLKEFEEFGGNIKDEITKMRVSHVISENARVHKSVEALERGDMNTFGQLMISSHNSLRDLYEVTCSELDVLVEEALKIDGVIGSRMTGAGFGGCTVSIVKEENVEEFIETVGKNYTEKTGLVATFYISEVGDGGKEIK